MVSDQKRKGRPPLDCICDGRTLCAVCKIRTARVLRIEHGDSFSIKMLKRYLPDVPPPEIHTLYVMSKMWV